MKKFFLLIGMLSIAGLGFAQVSKQQAIETVMNMIVSRDSLSVNVYMESQLQTDSYYKMSLYDSIPAPYGIYWLFFIDDMPKYGWGHDCRYAFINQVDGSISIRNSQTPPWHYKLKLETVLEPIGFSAPVIDTLCYHDTVLVTIPVEGKYAVLFSGGEESGQDQTCFWNALSHSYCGLLENGFKRENIFVLSFNGNTIDEEGNTTNRYLDLNQDGVDDILRKECSVENIQSVFDTLALTMQEGDLLYVYGTMHGFKSSVDTTRHGLWLWNQEPLYDTVFSSMLSSVNCSHIIVNIWSCFSGGIADDIVSISDGVRKTVLSCTGHQLVFRDLNINNYLKMDTYNYFANTAFRYYHSKSIVEQPWIRDTIIGSLHDTTLFGMLHVLSDINCDLLNNEGNGNGIDEINEIFNYTKCFDEQFDLFGIKYYDCGFKDDLLSLHGITGKIVTADTVNGSFHVEDSLLLCADMLFMEDHAKFYLFDANLIITDTAFLFMGDGTAIIARSGNCRVVVRGTLSLGTGVTFEARDGAMLDIVFENDTDLAVSDANFVNCTLTLPKRNVTFSRCRFTGTPFTTEINAAGRIDDCTVRLVGCDFVPNGQSIANAIYLKNYPHYLVQDCTIDATDGGTFFNGISIYYSGSNTGQKAVTKNTIKGCDGTGLLMYASRGDVRLNIIEDNGYGVKLLNNSNIGQLSGNCAAMVKTKTQYIHNNDYNEVYMTANCIPQTFRYNAIEDDDNVPFVHHDAYIGFGNVGETPSRGAIDVIYNTWGNNFTPAMHLYTNLTAGYECEPYWNMGVCNGNVVDAVAMLSEADSLNATGEYAAAKATYMQVVESYPSTTSAETALKTLLALEENAGNDYVALKDYYQTDEAIASDETLSHLASSLANKCDESLENYAEAIAWYENVLTDPETTFNDSIFSAIDLGNLYLRMYESGEKGICGKLLQYKPENRLQYRYQSNHALALLPKTVVVEKTQTDPSPIQELGMLVGENDTVLLTWNLPSGSDSNPMNLSWLTNDTVNDLVQAGYDSYMGNLYDTLDLRSFIGWKIESISFYKNSNWTHVVYVWNQKQGEEMQVLYCQSVPDDMPFGLNTIRLEEDLRIEPFTQYWFSLRIMRDQNQSGYTYPFGMVHGEQGVEGKSNLSLMPGNNSWFELPLPGMHFWIRARLVNSDNTQSNKDNQSLTGYRVYRDGNLIAEIPRIFQTYFTDIEFTREFDVEYCVTAVYGDEESEPVCVTVTITGIGENASSEGTSLSPNPTSGLVRIEGARVAEVAVCNALGQLVKTVRGTNEISLEGLPKGVYALRITDESGCVVAKKVVVE